MRRFSRSVLPRLATPEPCPEALDTVAVVIDPGRTIDRCFVAFGWDGRLCSHGPDPLAKGMGGIASVSDDPLRTARKLHEQRFGVWQFMSLPRGELEGQGSTATVGHHDDLCAKTSTASAKCLTAITAFSRSPFLDAPAAFGCALIEVPSRNTMPRSAPPAFARSNRRSQTPRRDHRMKICAAFHQSPSSVGIERHFAPFRHRQTIGLTAA